jgi:predicted transposase/invertase (TIGR01784 family)
MKNERELVSFDWALKKLLRAKANFKVLEGFLSELLHDDITIIKVIESKGDKESRTDKHNRVDVLVKDRLNRHIVVEVQNCRESDYFRSFVCWSTKILPESISSGKAYKHIARVVSVSIVYFDLGQGEDYIYEGRTEFHGVHRHDRLGLNEFQKSIFQVAAVEEVLPEYYILKVNKFDDVARDGLDQWIYFLKTGNIKRGASGKGLEKAKKVLDVLKLSKAEYAAYEAYIKVQRIGIGVAQSTILRAERAEFALEEFRRLKEEQRLKDEAFRQKEEERQLKEEAFRQKEQILAIALKALISQGMSESQARKTLGIDI